MEVHLENIGCIVQGNGLETELWSHMMPVPDGNSEHKGHRKDYREENMQLANEDDIVPSIDSSPIDSRQERVTLQGTFSDVLERLSSEPEIPTPYHSKHGRQKMLYVITIPI